jgi:hypothetical protein
MKKTNQRSSSETSTKKKLQLDSATLRVLDDAALTDVQGGGTIGFPPAAQRN